MAISTQEHKKIPPTAGNFLGEQEVEEPEEFPFTAEVGHTGVSPTNPLVNGIDFADRSRLTREKERGKAAIRGDASHLTGGSAPAKLDSLATSGDASLPQPSHSRRKSVQFAESSASALNSTSHNESPSGAGRHESPSQPHMDTLPPPPATPTRESYGARVISKLKTTLSTPITLARHKDQGRQHDGDSDTEGPAMIDDEAEESAPELGFSPSNMRRQVRRRISGRDERRRATEGGWHSQSPHGLPFSFHRSSSDYPGGVPPNLPPPLTPVGNRSPSASTSNIIFSRPRFGSRRTMSEIPEAQRGALSEDEGRDGILRRNRPKFSHRRRISQLTQDILSFDRSESINPGEQGSQHSKWNRVKARSANLIPFKSTGKKKKVPTPRDAQSTQLVASLAAGTRPALMVAAATQRDTHGHKRLPLLFELLRFKITDMIPGGNYHSKSDHHKYEFRIELQYGEKTRKMKWILQRSWSELYELHVALASSGRFRNLARGQAAPALPKFPKNAVPYLRGLRGLYDGENPGESGLLTDVEFTADGGTATPTADESGGEGISPMGRPRPSHRKSTMQRLQRTASVFTPDNIRQLGGLRSSGTPEESRKRREMYAEKLKTPIEQYLQSLFQVCLRGGDANRHNRVCRFLELSAIGIRLIPEQTYHGKEGPLWVKSIQGISFRENFKHLLHIHGYPRQWFFVRSSYVACVEHPNSTEIADVFLFDPFFKVETKETKRMKNQANDEPAMPDNLPDEEADDEAELAGVQGDLGNTDLTRRGTHQLKIVNTERRVKLLSSKRHVKQFSDSIMYALARSSWAKPHRFDSFAPIRMNCWAMPLIDGEAYMWKVSTAIHKAKHTIFIHDWWLSPEIYLRRPAASSQEWRLDRLLKRKADEGVKIYIIIYRNVESAFNLASERTKDLLGLASDNIFIQRSPHASEQKNFLYAHHEKVCVIDYLTAFCGGIDLCFGRWDTQEHRLADNTLTGFEPGDYPRDYDYCQLWPGKDYNNPRVHDFERVEWAYEETYDRSKVPRMPWHDIGVQLAGAPARDLCRHFVQRWNYLRRRPGGDGGSHHDKRRPVLLPCPDFTDRELRNMGLTGTCEVQILRSAGDWSMGLPKEEHSVLNAYVAAIRESLHFVYIENQFFVTSLPDKMIYNEIGDALVERAARAHRNGEKWRAVIMIPLLPGFAFQPRDWGATSLRAIMDMQFWSICRHEKSIYSRLKDMGIRAEDYIQFYSLRSWGEIDTKGTLVTEQLYIHAKAMVVDDRIAIIGSANINDRSMLGFRDSEIAVVIQDRASVEGTMAGKPFRKGNFAYDFRMRLMAEHLGFEYEGEDLATNLERSVPHPSSTGFSTSNSGTNHGTGTSMTTGSAVASMGEKDDEKHRDKDSQTYIPGRYRSFTNWVSSEAAEESEKLSEKPPIESAVEPTRLPLPDTDDTDIGGPASSEPLLRRFTDAHLLSLLPHLTHTSFPIPSAASIFDPLTPAFENTWDLVGANNTSLFRSVFHVQPDSLVINNEQHGEFNEAALLFAEHQHDTVRPTVTPRRAVGGVGSVEGPKVLLRDEAKQVLGWVQGHLVEWPRDWMRGSDWRKLADLIAPTAMFS